jgi:hypothetical protein
MRTVERRNRAKILLNLFNKSCLPQKIKKIRESCYGRTKPRELKKLEATLISSQLRMNGKKRWSDLNTVFFQLGSGFQHGGSILGKINNF